ncbi:MAG: hypothetical protein ACO2O2_17930 [Acidilobaceae archaeon]
MHSKIVNLGLKGCLSTPALYSIVFSSNMCANGVMVDVDGKVQIKI